MSDQKIRTYPISGDVEDNDFIQEEFPFARNILVGAVLLLILFFSGGFLAGCALGLTEADLMFRERDFKTLVSLSLAFLAFGFISLAALAKLVSCMVKAVRSDL